MCDCIGAVLSAKSRSDQQLSEARLKARKIVHGFHKAQDKMDTMEVKILASCVAMQVSTIAHIRRKIGS